MEIIGGNQKYAKYIDSNMVITEFILAELCFNLIRKMGKEKAFVHIDELSSYAVPVDKDIIKKAMSYRYELKDRKVSMTDCTGYFLAKSLGVKFLTGDKEFKDIEDVEFVK